MFTEYVFENRKYDVALRDVKSILFDIVMSEQEKVTAIISKVKTTGDKSLQEKLIVLCNEQGECLRNLLEISNSFSENLQMLDSYSRELKRIENKNIANIITGMRKDNSGNLRKNQGAAAAKDAQANMADPRAVAGQKGEVPNLLAPSTAELEKNVNEVAPGMPNMPKAAMPGAGAPGMPNMPKAAMPGAGAPGMPNRPKPAMPGAGAPGMPNMQAPTMPGAGAPGMPNMPKPAMPGAAPSVPDMPKPGASLERPDVKPAAAPEPPKPAPEEKPVEEKKEEEKPPVEASTDKPEENKEEGEKKADNYADIAKELGIVLPDNMTKGKIEFKSEVPDNIETEYKEEGSEEKKEEGTKEEPKEEATEEKKEEPVEEKEEEETKEEEPKEEKEEEKKEEKEEDKAVVKIPMATETKKESKNQSTSKDSLVFKKKTTSDSKAILTSAKQINNLRESLENQEKQLTDNGFFKEATSSEEKVEKQEPAQPAAGGVIPQIVPKPANNAAEQQQMVNEATSTNTQEEPQVKVA